MHIVGNKFEVPNQIWCEVKLYYACYSKFLHSQFFPNKFEYAHVDEVTFAYGFP